MELLHGGFQQFLGGGFGAAEVADFGEAHFGVAGQFGTGETLELAFAGGQDAGTDGGGVFDLAFVGEFFVVEARGLRCGCRRGRGGGAAAFFDGVIVEAAGVGVQVAVAISILYAYAL